MKKEPATAADALVRCRTCGRRFRLTPSERAWYRERRWPEPKRCLSCRAAVRAWHEQRDSQAVSAFSESDARQRERRHGRR